MARCCLRNAAQEFPNGPRSTISLKRSTQNLQLSTSFPADYPIYREQSGHRAAIAFWSLVTQVSFRHAEAV
jgi:hypothetical protein